MQNNVVVMPENKDYALIDSGEGMKLERFGQFVLARPDPQALWSKKLPEKRWLAADATFLVRDEKGSWSVKAGTSKEWPVEISGIKFTIKPTSFKHVGVFPEQAANWSWIKEVIQEYRIRNKETETEKPKILNLFGYTGGATLAAASAGAEVTHVDGSKTAVTWAKENADLNGYSDKPLRWIVDDATAFIKREGKRGKKYDGIIMDPPVFGRGPKGEVWKIEDDLRNLLELAKKILSDKPILFLLNGYASGYSALGYKNILEETVQSTPATFEAGELAIKEEQSERLLPAGIFARWQANF